MSQGIVRIDPDVARQSAQQCRQSAEDLEKYFDSIDTLYDNLKARCSVATADGLPAPAFGDVLSGFAAACERAKAAVTASQEVLLANAKAIEQTVSGAEAIDESAGNAMSSLADKAASNQLANQ